MASNYKTEFRYDTNTHTTTCTRRVNNKCYIGETTCHPDDYEFEAKLVGENFAYQRSVIQELCEKRNQLAATLKSLSHLYNLYKINDNIDLNSHECFLLRRQIKLYNKDLKMVRELIQDMKNELRRQIAERDVLHQKLKELRKENDK